MNTFPFPPAFEARMRDQLGAEWKEFEAVHLENPPASIRLNPEKKTDASAYQEIPWTTYGYYLPDRPVFTLDPSFHAGAYYVQEASSMFIEQAIAQHVNLNESLNVLDLCAAPGGKSTLLSTLLNQQSLLVANEVIRSRAGILTENIMKWGSNNVVVTNNDPEDFTSLTGFFDVIVVDAPCSGEGLFRKDPDAVKEWSVDNVSLCSARQKRIVTDVWPALKQDGILIYCTCTYNEPENEDNLMWLEQQQEIEFLNLKLNQEWGVEKISKGNCTGHRFYPHKVKGEGFFLSIVRKKKSDDERRKKSFKSLFDSPSKKTVGQLQSWVVSPGEKTFIQRGDLVQYFSKSKTEDIQFLVKQLRVIYAGTYMATVKHEKLIPEHAFALSMEMDRQNFFSIALSKEEALKYLRKDNLNVIVEHKGFALITYQDLALGWVNVLPNRINNLYPAEWRVRMSSV